MVFPRYFARCSTILNSGNQVFITGYQEVGAATGSGGLLNQPVLDLTLAKDRSKLRPTNQMVWGIPLVIGAKKGLPNFNKFSTQTQVQVTRKLQFHRPGTSNTRRCQRDGPDVCGRHYQRVRRRGLEFLRNDFSPQPAHGRHPRLDRGSDQPGNPEAAQPHHVDVTPSPVVATNIPANTWPFYNPATREHFVHIAPRQRPRRALHQSRVSFQRDLSGQLGYVRAADRPLRANARDHQPACSALAAQRENPPPLCRGGYTGLNRLVDYVNLDCHRRSVGHHRRPDARARLRATARAVLAVLIYTPSAAIGSMWCTNRQGGSTTTPLPTFGIMNQIEASSGPRLAGPDLEQLARMNSPPG